MPENLLSVKSGIDHLIDETQKQIDDISDTITQMSQMASTINDFVVNVLEKVNGNNDTLATNQMLASSLIEIRNYAVNKPTQFKNDIVNLNNKISAYEQCQILIDDAISNASEKKTERSPRVRKPRKAGTRPERLKKLRTEGIDNKNEKLA